MKIILLLFVSFTTLASASGLDAIEGYKKSLEEDHADTTAAQKIEIHKSTVTSLYEAKQITYSKYNSFWITTLPSFEQGNNDINHHMGKISPFLLGVSQSESTSSLNQRCELKACQSGLFCKEYQAPSDDKGNDCTRHSNCSSGFCNGINFKSSERKGKCLAVSKCSQLGTHGEECELNTVSCQHPLQCLNYSKATSSINSRLCKKDDSQCSSNNDCCSNKCGPGNKCKTNTICMKCSKQGYKKKSDRSCCPGLYANAQNVCVSI